MTPAHHETLMWNHITPPAPGSKRTTCPKCSQARKKPHRRCLTVWVDDTDMIRVKCWNCEWQDAIL